jgi:hypothetical protein
MPTSSGPNTVNDSVVFNFDTGDVANSWKGEPTTNLASGGDLIGMSGITLTYVGMEDGWKKYSMSGTFTGGGYPYTMYLQPVTFTGGVIYSTQAIVRTNALGKFNYFGTSGVSYVNEPKNAEGTLVQNTLADGSSYVARVGFIYTNTTSQPGYLFTNPINNTTFNSSTDFVYLKNFQIEQKAYNTPFTPSSRSNTQGLLDISGVNNIATLTNMTYGANNTISFDGTDDRIVISQNSNFYTNNWTWEFITRFTGNTGTYQGLVWAEGDTGGGSGLQYLLTLYNNSYFHYRINNTISGWANTDTSTITFTPTNFNHIVWQFDSGTTRIYVNGSLFHTNSGRGSYNGGTNSPMYIGTRNDGAYAAPMIAPIYKFYNRVLSPSEIRNNYIEYRTRFGISDLVYTYDEGANAAPYVGNWNNSTTYTMANFGGISNVTAHGWSSGPATYTLTLNSLPSHNRVRYKVYWHLVDSLDNETNQLFLMNSGGGETEFLRFTKVWNSNPSISILQSGASANWSGAQTYTYTPWTTATGLPVINGYYVFDSGIFDHTSTSFTARHVMGADQAQADEAEYLSHVVVELYN